MSIYLRYRYDTVSTVPVGTDPTEINYGIPN